MVSELKKKGLKKSNIDKAKAFIKTGVNINQNYYNWQ